jgi:phage-related minor tail protein
LGDLRTDTAETAETFKETLAPAIQQISLAFTNEFVNALLTGQNALDSFKSFAKNIVSQIISIFLQLAIVNRILNAIFGANTFSTLDLGGGAGLGGMKINPGTGLATGGSMMRGKPYLVGERGPELFVPSVAGTLKSGNDTRGMMGGGPPIIVNQSLNFSTGVVPTVRAEVQRMLPQISETTKASVLEATRRGGSYRRGLLGA